MANVFGILTAIVLALSAFIAHTNKGRYEQEIEKRVSAESALKKTEVRLETAKSDLKATEAKRSETETSVVALNRTKAAQEKSNGEIKTQIDSKAGEVAANKTKLEEIRAKLEGAGDLATLSSKLKATDAEIQELSQSIATSEASLANLSSDSNRLEKVIDNYRSVSALYPAKKSNPSLKTHISAIYPNWGFVTLGAGNAAGVVTNSTLNVIRDGEIVGKLLVTAAEGSTASASIVPDSVKADTTLSVGDSVVAGN